MRLWLFLVGFVLVAPSSIRSDDHQEETVAVSPGIFHGDPPVAPTIGFFLDDWQPKSFITPASQEVPASSAAASPGVTDTIAVDASAVITRIPPSAFGHNANTWMTAMITEPAFITPMTRLHPHIIRWPAGSGSDAYFWNSGAGDLPADVPASVLDKNGAQKRARYFFGKTTGPHSASLDDYYMMLQETGNEGLFTVNYGYARYGTSPDPVATAAHLAADWVRYDRGRTRYWELGNENFGDWEYGYRIDTTTNRDGQAAILTGSLYARHFKIFADSMRKAAAELGVPIYIGAVTAESAGYFGETPTRKNWNADMMKELNDKADFYVVHSYFTPYNKNSNAAEILYDATTVPGQVMRYVTQSLTANGAAIKPVAMDEWNMFARGSEQQVSNISGVFAVIVMGETLSNRFGLAARWDLLNGWAGGNDHGLFSAGDEPGIAKWTPRPSFYYLYFLQKMLGDRLVKTSVQGDTSLRAYASTFSSGEANIVIANVSPTARTTVIDMQHFAVGRRYYWYALQGGDDNGEFSRRVFVNGHAPASAAGGPDDYATIPAWSAPADKGIVVTVPAYGAISLTIDKK